MLTCVCVAFRPFPPLKPLCASSFVFCCWGEASPLSGLSYSKFVLQMCSLCFVPFALRVRLSFLWLSGSTLWVPPDLRMCGLVHQVVFVGVPRGPTPHRVCVCVCVCACVYVGANIFGKLSRVCPFVSCVRVCPQSFKGVLAPLPQPFFAQGTHGAIADLQAFLRAMISVCFRLLFMMWCVLSVYGFGL